jgi:hypothetical protein
MYNKNQPMEKNLNFLNICAGLVLGLFIGFLLGMSLSEIVGAIAAIFASAAIVFMGFSDKTVNIQDEKQLRLSDNPPKRGNAIICGVCKAKLALQMGLSDSINQVTGQLQFLNNKLKLIRTVFLCIGCIIGIGVGICIRSHNLLGTSPLQVKMQEMESIGFSGDDARRIIEAQLLVGQDTSKNTTGALFSNITSGSFDCKALNPDLYKLDDILNYFESHDELKEYGRAIRKYASKDEYKTLLKFIWNIHCNK